MIHFPENPNVIYYSSYGENGLNGKDIYVQRRLPAGGWGLPQVLKGGVNTPIVRDPWSEFWVNLELFWDEPSLASWLTFFADFYALALMPLHGGW